MCLLVNHGVDILICRYCELRSDYDKAQDLIRKMEKEMEILRKTAEEHEERHKSMYLKMYLKGQEAAKFEHADEVRTN